MKILYVVRDLNGKGGLQNFALSTAKGLMLNHEVLLLDWRTPHSHIQEGVVRYSPSFIGKKLYDKWFKQDINTVINGQAADVIHFWHIKSAMAVINTIDRINTPYILTCHGSEVLRKNVGNYQYDKFITALNKATAITTPSNFTKQYIVEHYGIYENKIHVVSPGIDVSSFKASEKGKGEVVIIGTITRFIKRKNVLNIIKSLEILHDNGVRFKYVLAGDGAAVIKRKIIRALQKSSFDWLYSGKISDEEKINDFYPSLNVFVLPPLEQEKDIEGFGIVFLEANASGVPVVAASTGGVSDAVKPGVSGEFADPTSPNDIADKIYKILTGKDYRKSARKWAQNFSQEKTTEKFQKLYEQILK